MLVTRLSSEKQVQDLINLHNKRGRPVAIDVETTGLSRFKDKIIAIIIDGDEIESACIFGPEHTALLNNLTVPVVLQNFKFDFTMLYPTVQFKHGFRDTMLLHNLWNENLPHSLDSMVQAWYRDDYKKVFWGKYKEFTDAPQDEQDIYAGKDVIYTKLIYGRLTAELEKMGIPYSLITYVHDFAYQLWCTEIQGVDLDVIYTLKTGLALKIKLAEKLKGMRELFTYEIRSLELQYYSKELAKKKTDKGKAGTPMPEFNFGSTKQLQDLIYGVLELPVQYSPDKTVTLDDGALDKLKDMHPMIPLLRDYRELQKIYTAFIESILEKQVDGKIYPSFNVNGTVTGRISCSEPNLQQMPAQGGIRAMIVPRAGYKLISCDYSQLEVTLAAHFSLDTNLLKVINEGVSLHDITANGLGIERGQAKTINFAVQYGAGPSKIQKILGCGPERANEVLSKYWETYPGLKKLMDECHRKVDDAEDLINPFGRRRRFGVTKKTPKWEREKAKRQAFNSLIQGTGADITNTAFTRIAQELQKAGQGRALFVIHDEILIEVEQNSVVYWNQRLKDVMVQITNDIHLRVPLAVESSGGMDKWED